MLYRHTPRIDPAAPLASEIRDAIDLQNQLRHRVKLSDDFGPLKTVAGIDVGYDLARNLTKAVIVLMDWESLTLATSVIAYSETTFTYVPGLLSFREIPAILRALDCLPQKPDLLMVDGQGVSHPRRLGIAAHLGVITNLPAIGVAKSRLTGKYAPLPPQKFSTQPLMDRNEQIGTVLQSKEKCNPLFVSAGHRITHETALDLTKRCIAGYRLPEPTRIADRISKWTLAPAKEKDPSQATKDLF